MERPGRLWELVSLTVPAVSICRLRLLGAVGLNIQDPPGPGLGSATAAAHRREPTYDWGKARKSWRCPAPIARGQQSAGAGLTSREIGCSRS
jgi:hypothetical protein